MLETLQSYMKQTQRTPKLSTKFCVSQSVVSCVGFEPVTLAAAETGVSTT